MDTDSNSDKKIDDSDIENSDLESNNCIICFEPIIDSSLNNDLIMRSHAKNFHYDCVKPLNKCPLCRADFNRNSSDYIVVNEPGCDGCFKPFFFGALCGSFMLWLLFLMICNPIWNVCHGIYEHKAANNTDFNSTTYS